MKEYIYPKIHFTANLIQREDVLEYYAQVSTYLRKQHTDGKWYLQYFFNSSKGNTKEAYSWCLEDFQRNIYNAQLFGKVIPEAKTHFGPLFILDEDQRSEEERLLPFKIGF